MERLKTSPMVKSSTAQNGSEIEVAVVETSVEIAGVLGDFKLFICVLAFLQDELSIRRSVGSPFSNQFSNQFFPCIFNRNDQVAQDFMLTTQTASLWVGMSVSPSICWSVRP